MDNATRRQLLQRHKMSGFPGSIIDVFQAYEQGVDLIDQYQQQQQMQVAQTPQQRQQGLRPAHQAGNTNASMAFPNTKPNASFNTVGMKAPIDMKQYDDRGNLVKSYDAVPPGVTDLKMSSQGGTVIETPAKMQGGGEYNMNRAVELGYTADKTGHWPSVDYTNGMWLKSSQHPTAIKEFLHGYLGGDHYKTHDIVKNPQGYFGENQLQYVPKQGMKTGGVRKYQTGGTPKWQDTIDDINKNHGPDQLGDTLDLNALHLIAMERMGVKDPVEALLKIKWHETGPNDRMQPNAVQIAEGMVPGKGKGWFMYDQPSTLTDATRLRTIARNMGMETPKLASQLLNSDGTSRADTLTGEQQDMLMMANLIASDDAPFRAYGRGDASIEDLWYYGVNKRTDEAKARQEFRNSLSAYPSQEEMTKYLLMEPRPNYFERRDQKRYGGKYINRSNQIRRK